MAANLGFIAHAAQSHACEAAPGGSGDAFAERGLADAGWADQAEDRTGGPLGAHLDGEALQNAFLDLVKPIVVLVQNALGARHVTGQAAAFLPGNAHHPVDVGPHHGAFRRHRRHLPELAELGKGLFLRLLGQAGFFDRLGQGLEFVRRLLDFAEFLLDRLHLFVEVVLALALFHLLVDAPTDRLVHLALAELTGHEAHQQLPSLAEVKLLKHLLLALCRDVDLRRHSIEQPACIRQARQGSHDLLGYLAVVLRVALELRQSLSAQRLRLLFLEFRIRQRNGRRGDVGSGEVVFLDPGPRLAFHENLHGTTRR